MNNFDDSILDEQRIDEEFNDTNIVAPKPRSAGSKGYRARNQSQQSSGTNRPSTKNAGASCTTRNKKAKRLPWNSEVLRDRFTPQSFPVQLVDACTSFNNLNALNNTAHNLLVLLRSDEWRNYLKLMTIKQYALGIGPGKRKLILLITNMGSEVSKYVEIVSRHTTLKIAGIDYNLMTSQLGKPANANTSENYCIKLKSEAQILIMSVDILLEWFKRGYLSVDELVLIIFDEVTAAFHNDSYKVLMSSYITEQAGAAPIVGFGTLTISQSTTHSHLTQQIDYLKTLFRANYVEAATDLVDTHNLFYGIEPLECIQICQSLDLADPNEQIGSSNMFQQRLLGLIKETYAFLDDLNVPSPNKEENFIYIHTLCVRVLNECVYLLKEVGIWCLAKSLLPIICQIDKLSAYIEKTNRSESQQVTQEAESDRIELLSSESSLQQELLLQYTSTSLRHLREICIGQFVQSKNAAKCDNNSMSQIGYFFKNFTTPKVKSLVELLRAYKKNADEFCCLIFVQNKQVATSLSLLLKKLCNSFLFNV